MKRITIILAITFLTAGCGSKPVPEALSVYDKATDTVAVPRKPNTPNTSATNPEFTITGDLNLDDIVYDYLPRGPDVYGQTINEVADTLMFSVNSNGQVNPLMIVRQSTGYSQWDNECRRSLMKWRFKTSEVDTRTAEITFV